MSVNGKPNPVRLTSYALFSAHHFCLLTWTSKRDTSWSLITMAILYYFDLRFINFVIFGLREGRKEKFSFDLWRILKVPNFRGCDL